MKEDTAVTKEKTMAVVEFTGYNAEEVQKYLSAVLEFVTNGNCKCSVVTEVGRKRIHEVLKK